MVTLMMILVKIVPSSSLITFHLRRSIPKKIIEMRTRRASIALCSNIVLVGLARKSREKLGRYGKVEMAEYYFDVPE
jgi:hypothetical protein